MTTATTTDTTPRLRGWLHLATLPIIIIAGLTLTALGPTLPARAAAAIYALASMSLFGISALYHRANLTTRTRLALKRFDHANIYLIIAGTYTPIALIALEGTPRIIVLATIWIGATAGVIFRTAWTAAPRWLYTGLYIALGWIAIFFIPQLLQGAGITATILVICGGILYTIGGIIYALKRPNPSPQWFGFHELFHSFTIAAYITQYIAVSIVIYTAT
ncbi:PAQR family membrane homeostasis protein TrhA [Natronoglycomyces albus]|uniref:Hemolysin III family protein n=1 Tax=Natronoglycomyces albus TaxID=2811108 RepID=A0A895XT11_9ACTN|nr:hemolysin III family protein [Natronoglycomyces albus]QSB06792.1 hemolysin III family protein [Natronoglycomyces albus]